MAAGELVEWAAYERVAGPLGPERMDYLLAIVAATVANTASKTRRTPNDYIPQWDRDKDRITDPAEMRSHWRRHVVKTEE